MADEKSPEQWAFLITQIGVAGSPQRQWADDVRQHVVEPAVSQAGLSIYRSDLDLRPGPISCQMVRKLAEASVVIADLTGRNPNVYYELGIAHALSLPVIVLIDEVSGSPSTPRTSGPLSWRLSGVNLRRGVQAGRGGT